MISCTSVDLFSNVPPNHNQVMMEISDSSQRIHDLNIDLVLLNRGFLWILILHLKA